MKHTIVLGGRQFRRSIPLSKRGGQNEKSGRIFCVRQVYFTSKSWRQIWWRVNQPFKHPFFIRSEVNSTMRCSFFFYHTDLGHNLFFFALFKPIILQVFTIWRDKYCTHSISRTIEARAGFAQQIIALTTL